MESVQQISVAVSRASSGMFWEVVTRCLEDVPDIEVFTAESEQELESALSRDGPLVLIIEQTQCDPDYQRYYEFHPGLAVIALDPSGAETIVRLRDLGRDLLVRLVRTLSAEPLVAGSGNVPRFRLLRAADVKQLADKRTRVETNAAVPYTSTREHLEDTRHWLDLCFHECLVEEAVNSGESSIPGWAMSAERARSLLGEVHARADGASLRNTREQFEAAMAEREGASRASPPRLVALADAFDLSEMDRKILAFLLAPELDGRYARIYGFLNDDLTRRRPTPSLLRQLLLSEDQLGWDVRQMLVGERRLAKFGVVTVDRHDPAPASEVGLMAAPEVVAYLLAEPGCSPEYGAHLALCEGQKSNSTSGDPATRLLQERLVAWRMATGPTNGAPIVQLVGDTATVGWFRRVVLGTGDAVVVFDVGAIGEYGPDQLADRTLGAARAAVLHDAILLVIGLASLQKTERERVEQYVLAELSSRVRRLAVHGDAPWILPGVDVLWRVERGAPTVKTRTALWQERAQAAELRLSKPDAGFLAATLRLDEPEIDAVLRLYRGNADNTVTLSAIQAAARTVVRRIAPNTVRRVEATFTWNDIVLPAAVLAHLRQIPDHVRYSGRVLEDWGYRARVPYGHGVTTLFSGASGTGKTMAAQIIAAELGVELFQVDLAKTVSKYIGETEKNLDAVFEAAEKASAVLLFDEADALFGKRTEVRDAHDRYANVEVAYLLQRMEAYAGLAVLTTNFRQNLDNAFMRRLRFVIDFPTPNADEREAIWQRVFPVSAPLGKDVNFTFLARRLDLTGGNIQQIALRAAFAAVADRDPIAMRHIVQATREELHKLGMINAEKWLAELAA